MCSGSPYSTAHCAGVRLPALSSAAIQSVCLKTEQPDLETCLKWALLYFRLKQLEEKTNEG